MNTPNKPATENNNKPVHEIRHGGIKVTIWKNETEKGPRFNTTFERAYKDNDEWKTTQSFSRDDLLLLSLMTQWAFEWIIQQPAGAKKNL